MLESKLVDVITKISTPLILGGLVVVVIYFIIALLIKNNIIGGKSDRSVRLVKYVLNIFLLASIASLAFGFTGYSLTTTKTYQSGSNNFMKDYELDAANARGDYNTWVTLPKDKQRKTSISLLRKFDMNIRNLKGVATSGFTRGSLILSQKLNLAVQYVLKGSILSTIGNKGDALANIEYSLDGLDDLEYTVRRFRERAGAGDEYSLAAVKWYDSGVDDIVSWYKCKAICVSAMSGGKHSAFEVRAQLLDLPSKFSEEDLNTPESDPWIGWGISQVKQGA